MNGDMIQRIQRLEDMAAIQKLKHRYCNLADAAYREPSKWDELVAHFTQDAWVDFGEYGRYDGKEGVRKFFKTVAHNFLSYAAHMVTNAVIEVSGKEANGSWYLFCPGTDRSSGAAVWVQGRYRDQFIKLQGNWQWTSITFIAEFMVPVTQGWSYIG